LSSRASYTTVRGLRFGSVLLVGLLFGSVGSAIAPQSAQAEGFLVKTVRCLVGGVVRTECQPPASSPSTTHQREASGAHPQSPQGTAQTTQAQPAIPPATPPATQSQAKTGDNGQTLSTVGVYEPIDSTVHTPIEIAYVSSARSYDSFQGVSAGGWVIAGIAWYWWALGIATIGFLSYRSIRRSRRATSLSKAV
jgi:hypothetical protein